jgi:hypothetical protein
MFLRWLLIVAMATLILVPFVWMVTFALTQVKRGWRVFYATWALVVLLALVLPFAIPYAVWADNASICARRAEVALGEEHRRQFALVSVRVLSCPDSGVDWFSAELTFDGPYGVPTSTYDVTPSGASLADHHTTGELLGLIALAAGVLAVSIPFIILLLRSHFRRLRAASVRR